MVQLPCVDDLISVIHTCRKEKILVNAYNVHAKLQEVGLGTHDAVANYLVPMFVECGSLADAQQAFDQLSYRDEHSWTSLISGYVENGHIREALDLYEKMHQASVYPSCYTITALIKASARVNDVEIGKEMHAQAVNNGFDQDVFVGSSLVHMYVKCGLLDDSRMVFDNLNTRSTVSWTNIIAGYAEYGLRDAALTCLEQMQSEGLLLDAATFVCALKACGNIGSLCKGREIHDSITSKGLEKEVLVGNTLVDMYAKCGAVEEARGVSDMLPSRDLVSWTALIGGYAEHGPGEEALKCFEKMKSEGIIPDSVTFASVLKACGNIGALERGRQICGNIPQSYMQKFFYVGNAAAEMYVKCGSLNEAQEVFSKLQQRDWAPWNTLIAGYAEIGASDQVCECVERMELEGVAVDARTYVSILKACGSRGSIDEARELHSIVVKKGFEMDLSVGNALIDMYVKKVAIVEAHKVLHKLPVRDVVSWTALIGGYAEEGPGEKAISCHAQMQADAVPPNSITLLCVLKACGNTGASVKGQEIHADIVLRGFEDDLSLCNTLIDMYAKVGLLFESQKVFDMLSVQDLVSWNAMIKAYGINHDAHMAVQCFEEMQGKGVKPDAVTFTCVLYACSRAKLLPEGRKIFNVMRQEYGIVPTIDHYTCMVDLHAKSGCLLDVLGFLDSSGSRSMWTALLTASKIHCELELAERCFEELIHMDPEQAAPYVLMAKTYEGAGMWEEAHQIEELRKQAGAKKKPAMALIEVNRAMHEFVVGDKLSAEVSAILDILSSRLKREGHVPQANLDVMNGIGFEKRYCHGDFIVEFAQGAARQLECPD